MKAYWRCHEGSLMMPGRPIEEVRKAYSWYHEDLLVMLVRVWLVIHRNSLTIVTLSQRALSMANYLLELSYSIYLAILWLRVLVCLSFAHLLFLTSILCVHIPYLSCEICKTGIYCIVWLEEIDRCWVYLYILFTHSLLSPAGQFFQLFISQK